MISPAVDLPNEEQERDIRDVIMHLFIQRTWSPFQIITLEILLSTPKGVKAGGVQASGVRASDPPAQLPSELGPRMHMTPAQVSLHAPPSQSSFCIFLEQQLIFGICLGSLKAKIR